MGVKGYSLTPQTYNILFFYCACYITDFYSFEEVIIKNECYQANLTPIFQNEKIILKPPILLKFFKK